MFCCWFYGQAFRILTSKVDHDIVRVLAKIRTLEIVNYLGNTNDKICYKQITDSATLMNYVMYS